MWNINIWPNGVGWIKDDIGTFRVGLSLCSWPSNISKMEIQWTVSMKQFNFKKTIKDELRLSGSSKITETVSFQSFKGCNDLEIVINILILREFDDNDKEIEDISIWDEFIQNDEKQNDAVKDGNGENEEFASYQNKIDEKLSLYDVKINSLNHELNRNKQQLKQLMLENKEKDQQIKSLKDALTVTTHQIQQLLQTNKQTQDDLAIKAQQIQQLSQENKQKQQQNEQEIKLMNDKLTQLLEEEKIDNNDNNNNDILIEINKLKEEINKIKSNKNAINIPLSGLDELRIFFECEVKLPQYIEVMIENGFEDLESLNDINSDDLKEIGVKIAHRKKILRAIQQKQNKELPQQQPYEGHTAYI